VPSGKVHTATSSYLAVLSFLLAPVFSIKFFYMGLGIFLGVIITPDHDLEVNYSHYIIKMFFGEKAEWFWRLYWHRYAIVVPHRHWISHSYVISTFIRFIYAFWWLFVVLWYFGWDKTTILQFYPIFMWIFVGLSLSDAFHVMMDKYSTWSKKR